jgi:uncharacterized protein (DUF2235 family)
MKRIVICADGTWNHADQQDPHSRKRRPTNVTKVARAILPRADDGIDQVVFYHEGIGTAGGIDRFTGGAFGTGIERNVRSLYRSILYNWEPGDELFFFGFSRGAFTVRTLAGFMYDVGLLEKDDDYYLPDVYKCYERGYKPGSPERDKVFRNIKVKRSCPPIKFIGVWDTVGALGAPGLLGHLFNSGKYRYHQVGLNPCIANAYHALAIDEHRKPFAPSVWKRPADWTGSLEQAWFAGVHTNVGGSATPDGLANEALHWMVEKAESLGLTFDDAFLAHYRPCFDSIMQKSMTFMYRLLGQAERRMGQYSGDGEEVHQSAIDRMKFAASDYDPANLKAYLTTGGATTSTARVPRGVPCGATPALVTAGAVAGTPFGR